MIRVTTDDPARDRSAELNEEARRPAAQRSERLGPIRTRVRRARLMFASTGIACLALVVAGMAMAQSRPDAARATTTESGQAAVTINDLKFLAGAWVGSIGTDKAEEHWSEPQAGNIVGMFRWVGADNSLRMLEILSITEEEGEIHLRLIHFSGKLEAWESEPLHLKLAALEDRLVRFEPVQSGGQLAHITYDRKQHNALTITVAFRPQESGGEAARPPLVFNLKRAAAASDVAPAKP